MNLNFKFKYIVFLEEEKKDITEQVIHALCDTPDGKLIRIH